MRFIITLLLMSRHAPIQTRVPHLISLMKLKTLLYVYVKNSHRISIEKLGFKIKSQL